MGRCCEGSMHEQDWFVLIDIHLFLFRLFFDILSCVGPLLRDYGRDGFDIPFLRFTISSCWILALASYGVVYCYPSSLSRMVCSMLSMEDFSVGQDWGQNGPSILLMENSRIYHAADRSPLSHNSSGDDDRT